MVKQRTFVLALAAALLMMLLIGSVAFADGNTGTAVATNGKDTVCVDGYVINHREQPVDGTKTVPPLVVEAVPAGTDANGAAAAVVATANVDKNGYFKFASLAAGTYNFRLKLPAGWEGIVPQVRLEGTAETGFTEFKSTGDYKNAAKCYRIIFKIRRLVTIPVLKWEEKLDGTVIPGEDWNITATPVNDPFAKVITATITGGQALLTLTPGTWNVAETVKSGWVPLTPSTVQRVVDQWQATGAINPIVFKNREPVCHPKIIITKTGFGTNPKGDPEPLGTIAGWKFTVSRADGTATSITKTTGGDGVATFDNLTPGVYKVTETVQKGWEVEGDNPIVVTLMDCEEFKYTFTNHELIGKLRIYGTKWFKAWEPPYKGTLVGLPGWTITATLVGTESLPLPAQISTVTNGLGKYEFTQAALQAAGMGFPGASIKVCEEKRDHWIPKSAECVTVKFPYPVPADFDGVRVDFTNVQDPPVASAPAAISRAPVATSTCSAYHTVRSGDTLAKVAGKYGVSGSSVIRANGIRNANVIYLGQQLCIPR